MDDTSSAVADAPASTSTPSPSPAAPASSTPEPTTNRPSFKEALKIANAGDIVTEHQRRKGGRPPTAPAGAITADGVPAAAAPDGSVAAVDQAAPVATKGPVPFEVHDTAMKNARTKGAQEAEAKFRQQFGDPTSLAEITTWARRAATDRVGFLRDVINEALADPQLGPQVMSLAGTTLRGQKQPQQPAAAAEAPSVFTKGQDGQWYYDPSKQDARDQWLRDQFLAEVDGRVNPLEQAHQTQQERELAFERQRQQAAWRDRTLTDVKALPFFTDHEKDIKAAYAAMPPTSGHPAEEAQALYKAYIQVVGAKRDALAQEKVLANLKRQAGASTLNPAATGAPAGIPKNVSAKTGGTFKDALAWAQTQTAGR